MNPPKFIVRSKLNPTLILTTSGEFVWEGIVGPGGEHSAKIYKRRSSASKVRGGNVEVEEYNG